MTLTGNSTRTRRNCVKVIRKTRSVDGRKRMVCQHEVAGQGEIVRYVSLRVLRETEQDTVGRAGGLEVKVVHLAVIHVGDQALPVMTDVEGHRVRSQPHRYGRSRGKQSRSLSGGSRKGSKVFVEAAILFDDEDHVLNLVDARCCRGAAVRCRLGMVLRRGGVSGLRQPRGAQKDNGQQHQYEKRMANGSIFHFSLRRTLGHLHLVLLGGVTVKRSQSPVAVEKPCASLRVTRFRI